VTRNVPESIRARVGRLARETVAVAARVARVADPDRELELEYFWIDGYRQAQRDARQGRAR
jgi:hypothetical protein